MPTILVTNDDGISSSGIKALARILKTIGDVYVVAPETEQSAVAHALTLHRPLRVEKTAPRTYFINGTPTDCVIIGVNKILPRKPDIIVSGINNGANLGDDITYSGTVAAAIEGTLLGIPSIAASIVTENHEGHGFRKGSSARLLSASTFIRSLAVKVLDRGLPPDTLLNVNLPDSENVLGTKITKQGKMVYDNGIKELKDPRGRQYYWIGGGVPNWEKGENTDFQAVNEGYISVTPVHLDLTNYEALKHIKNKWDV